MPIPKFKPLENISDANKGKVKVLLIGVLVLLLGAFGLEVGNADFDLGKLLGGSSLEEAKVSRDEAGNILFYDKEGNVTSDANQGKRADEYNCEDFANQKEAQDFFTKVGGTGNDVNRLDGDKDGTACESLPQGK